MGKNKEEEDNGLLKSDGLILVSILQGNRNTISDLSKRCRMSYLYTMTIIKKLERKGLIKTRKDNKFRFVSLTEKGAVLAEKIREIISIYKEEKLMNEGTKVI
ncbi:MAG: winged helix DNA-binding protein [Nitrososphaerota archaeon]|nr:winged helix DNA-binding protein [Nitrososphaerota archaeon]